MQVKKVTMQTTTTREFTFKNLAEMVQFLDKNNESELPENNTVKHEIVNGVWRLSYVQTYDKATDKYKPSCKTVPASLFLTSSAHGTISLGKYAHNNGKVDNVSFANDFVVSSFTGIETVKTTSVVEM